MGYMGGFMSGLSGGMTDAKKKGQSGAVKKIMDYRKKKKIESAATDAATQTFPQFKRGGRVKKTGLAKVHKGERVLTKRQAKKYRGRSKGKKR